MNNQTTSLKLGSCRLSISHPSGEVNIILTRELYDDLRDLLTSSPKMEYDARDILTVLLPLVKEE